MATAIRVIIGGREYSLKGDNEQLVRQAADDVNKQFTSFGLKHNEESSTTLGVLAALNLAEQSILNRQQIIADSEFISNELDAMANFIINNLNN